MMECERNGKRFSFVANPLKKHGARDRYFNWPRKRSKLTIDVSKNDDVPASDLTMPVVYLDTGAFVTPGADKKADTIETIKPH